jgi:hypothetical protein
MESKEATSESHTTKEVALCGGCFCGGIKFTSSTLPKGVTNCHCLTCRKLSGGPFITFAGFPLDSITWESKETLRTTSYSSVATRGFCTDCGSNVVMQYNCQPGRIHIAVGIVDESSLGDNLKSLRPEEHIFVGYGKKASWFDVPNDGLCRWDGFDDAFQAKLDEAQKNETKEST